MLGPSNKISLFLIHANSLIFILLTLYIFITNNYISSFVELSNLIKLVKKSTIKRAKIKLLLRYVRVNILKWLLALRFW